MYICDMEKTTDITTIVSKELINKSFDFARDMAEIGLDQFIKDGFLRDIPLVNMVAAFYNVTNSIVSRNNARKILVFFQEFNSGKIDDNKFNEFAHKMKTDNHYRTEVVETIILLNERFLKTEKSKILANLVIAHINGHLSWAEFSDLTYVLDNIHPKCYFLLKEMSNEPYWRSTIISDAPAEALIIAAGIGHRKDNNFIIVELGQKLYELGIKPANL